MKKTRINVLNPINIKLSFAFAQPMKLQLRDIGVLVSVKKGR